MSVLESVNRKPSHAVGGLETALLVGAPLGLAVLELFHPHPHDLFHLDIHRWLVIHYLQTFLFPLAALAMAGLVHAHSEPAATLCRAAMFVFAVSYTVFDTAAGIVTGELVKAAQISGVAEAWRMPVMAVWMHPLIGGSPHAAYPPFFAMLGTLAWLVGALAAALTLRRAGSGRIPVALLVVSALGLFVFHSHAWPGGPLTFGSLAAAAAWRQWERN